jgi:malate synthase
VSRTTRASLEIAGDRTPRSDAVLTPEALAFVAALEHEFGSVRERLLASRAERQAELDAGVRPDFLPGTRSVREGTWRVASAPPDLERRRVEITGPVDAKMMINALNSGADVFMADFEDALSPTWANVVEGQANLQVAVRRTLAFTSPEGKAYRLGAQLATLVVRPRGWHLVERHARLDGKPVSASLFDFGLHFFHNARELLERGSGPYFYLPKLESHLEARLWNDVFTFAQRQLGLAQGSVRATVLIETILAAFEMEEILHELSDHAAGLNAGRWDYIFSIIKKFSHWPEFVLPDRAQVTMGMPFMRAYSQLLVKTCHRRGAHAIGGMSAYISSRRDPAVNEAALARVREDKTREAEDGFDGAWVAHPDLVGVVGEIFDRKLAGRANQKERLREDVRVEAGDLLDVHVPGGEITETGLRSNVEVALQYLEAWLTGSGAVAIHNLMEDTATAEIARAQLWQWVRHGARLADGRTVTAELYRQLLNEEAARLELDRARGDAPSRFAEAAELLDELVQSEDFTEFLTLPGDRRLE